MHFSTGYRSGKANRARLRDFLPRKRDAPAASIRYHAHMHGRPSPTRAPSFLAGPAFLAGLVGASGLLAQPGTPEPGTPAPRPAVVVPRVIVAPAEAPTLEPVRPNQPPTAAQDLALNSNPPLLREGAFVSGARGQLVKGKSGRWYAIFDADGSGRMLPPMIVMENANLAAMERVAGREAAGTRVKISGRVTVYRDRNFLLPTAPPLLERPVAADPDAAANSASREASAAANAIKPGQGPSEPNIDQIIADLDKAVGARKTGPASTRPAAPGPGITTVQEPTEPGVTSGYLTARRSRIVRGADGLLTAVMDSGTAGRTEGPMVLLPCQNLTALESIIDTGGEGTTFTLTGDVFVYRGRRYLLPSMYTVNRNTDIVMPTH